MIALQVEDIKTFTKQLLLGGTFDGFLVREAEIVTYNRFTIDGAVRQGFYTEEEAKAGRMERFSFWKTLRPFCFSLIKGSRLPERFLLVFQMTPEAVAQLLLKGGLSFTPEQVNGLYLNVRYEDQRMMLITGTSVSQFTLDKSLDREWDEAVRRFLKEHQIIVTEQ